MPALSPEDLDAVAALVDDVERRVGHPVIDEHRWHRMAAGDRSAVAGLVARAANDDVIAYAQVTRLRQGEWEVDLVVHPLHRDGPLLAGLAAAALEVVRREGGGHVQAWVAGPSEADDRALGDLGLVERRDLLELRRPLPAPPPPDGFRTRPFVPGADDEAWLALNNELFAWHPEQGGWTSDDVDERLQAPWFDAEGFLLHHDDGGSLDGFCWTKVHPDGVGEIYVIAGRPGLGKPLVLAGLDDLHRRRGCAEALLYSDAGNERAVALYDGLGFGVDHVNRSYGGTVEAAEATG
jgi:mycothiol synthase